VSYICAGLAGNGEDLEGGRAGSEADLLLLSPHLGEGGAHPDGGGRTDHLQHPDGGMRKQGIIHKDMRIWCCYIKVDSATTALQNGACTYWCFS
jgi:hypothetical protein